MDKPSYYPPFGLRMSPALKTWVKGEADKNHRSMNSELVTMIETEKRRREELVMHK